MAKTFNASRKNKSYKQNNDDCSKKFVNKKTMNKLAVQKRWGCKQPPVYDGLYYSLPPPQNHPIFLVPLVYERGTKKIGFGTIFSLIVVYFIFLYSRDKGWKILALISKWYLLIVGGLMALSFGILLLIVLLSLSAILIATLRLQRFNKRHKEHKKQEAKGYVDAEYKVKE